MAHDETIEKDPSRAMLSLAFLGLMLSLVVEVLVLKRGWFRGAVSWNEILALCSCLFFVGFGLRVLRRKLFFADAITLHQAISFDSLFQGATFLYPQLPYPTVEMAFLRRETSAKRSQLNNWFTIRSTSAVSIPLTLLATFCALKGWLGMVVLVTLLIVGHLAFSCWWIADRPVRYLGAVLLGVGAVLAEAAVFAAILQSLEPATPAWLGFGLYAITLVTFELSPIPLSLGMPEIAFGTIAFFTDLQASCLFLPLLYRLTRGVPILGMTLFYLPRHKLSVFDLYQPGLAAALESAWIQTREKAGGKAEPEMYLSVVIPAYNEEERLPVFLEQVIQFASSLKHRAEVLVVDDGSTDKTAEFVEAVAKKHPVVRLIQQPKNQGKGAAVKTGMIAAKGEYLLFADADGATPIEELNVLLPMMEKGADVVIASRKLAQEAVKRSYLRSMMGAAFYRLTNLLAVPGITDTQCGFKLFHHRAAEHLFPRLRETGWAFDVEVLFLAQKLGMTIKEVPVQWTAISGSKVNLVKDTIKMGLALLRIRKRSGGLLSEG